VQAFFLVVALSFWPYVLSYESKTTDT